MLGSVGWRPDMRDLGRRIVRELVVRRLYMRGADGRSCPAGGRGGGLGRHGQAGYPYRRPGWCRSVGRACGGADAAWVIIAGDVLGGSGGGRASP